jgi:hypothetical protein
VTELYALLAAFRRDSADRRRGVRRYYIPPAERRKLKAIRARQRAQRAPTFRPWNIVIRPINPGGLNE